ARRPFRRPTSDPLTVDHGDTRGGWTCPLPETPAEYSRDDRQAILRTAAHGRPHRDSRRVSRADAGRSSLPKWPRTSGGPVQTALFGTSRSRLEPYPGPTPHHRSRLGPT